MNPDSTPRNIKDISHAVTPIVKLPNRINNSDHIHKSVKLLPINELEDESIFWINSTLFDMSFEIIDYCRQHSPSLLNHRNSLNSVLDLLSDHVNINRPRPPIIKDDVSDDELIEESLIYEK